MGDIGVTRPVPQLLQKTYKATRDKSDPRPVITVGNFLTGNKFAPTPSFLL